MRPRTRGTSRERTARAAQRSVRDARRIVQLARRDTRDASRIGRAGHTQKRSWSLSTSGGPPHRGASVVVDVQLFPKILRGDYEEGSRPDRQERFAALERGRRAAACIAAGGAPHTTATGLALRDCAIAFGTLIMMLSWIISRSSRPIADDRCRDRCALRYRARCVWRDRAAITASGRTAIDTFVLVLQQCVLLRALTRLGSSKSLGHAEQISVHLPPIPGISRA